VVTSDAALSGPLLRLEGNVRFRYPDRAGIVTIRTKILLTFLGLAAITGCLGFAAIHSVGQSGRLVLHIYDQPLMAINHARQAEADFAAMRLALLRPWASTGEQRNDAGDELAALSAAVENDLGAAQDRADSPGAAAAARAALNDFRLWNVLRLQDSDDTGKVLYRPIMEQRADAVVAKFDALREAAVEDAVRDRATTIASIRRYRIWCIDAGAAHGGADRGGVTCCRAHRGRRSGCRDRVREQ
jgi:hypothetical protein